jgi:hypothetical protein
MRRIGHQQKQVNTRICAEARHQGAVIKPHGKKCMTGHGMGFGVMACVMGLLPRRELHDLCAGASGLNGSPAMMWSAVQGSFGLAVCPHSQQCVAVSRMALARLR